MKWTLILAMAALLPGLLLAQEKPEKGKQKIVVIKKSVDENGNKVVEKIVREADGDEKLEWKDEEGHVIIKLGKGDAEWESPDDIDIGLDGLAMELEEHLEGLDEQLRNIEVEVGELEDGMKNLRILIEPDGEVIEWQGLGDFPEELEQRLEQKGLHFRSLEGEDFAFAAPPNKALLGDIHFFSKEGKKAGRRKVIILKDGDVIMEREDEDAPGVPEPDETRPALELEAFEAFPNPADNQLTVRFAGKQAPVTIRLLDAAGQQVYKEYIQDFEGRYDQRIGLQGIPDGLLLLTIEQEGRVFTEKVMVARQ